MQWVPMHVQASYRHPSQNCCSPPYNLSLAWSSPVQPGWLASTAQVSWGWHYNHVSSLPIVAEMQVFVFTRQALYQLSYLPDLYFSLFADLPLAQTDLEPNLQLWPALNSQKPSFSYSQVLDSQAWVTSPVLCLCLVLWTVSNQTPRSLNGHCSAISLNDLLNCHVISELEMSLTPSCSPLPPAYLSGPHCSH